MLPASLTRHPVLTHLATRRVPKPPRSASPASAPSASSERADAGEGTAAGFRHERSEIGRRVLVFGAVLSSPAVGRKARAANELTDEECKPCRRKRKNLPAEEMAEIVTKDVVERQFLATADFSPEIYSPYCTFTDPIDTYTYDKFVKGTSKLFDSSQSYVNLVGDVEADDNQISFQFEEELAFNIPFKPKVNLSGKIILKRGADGLIESYTEIWDQTPGAVVATAHF